jgi:Spy/CpxP family protein refolding chaperone
MFARLAFAIAVIAAGQMLPGAASACASAAQSQIGILDAELPKVKLTRAQRARVDELRTKAIALIGANKQYEASRAAQTALAIIGYRSQVAPSRC